MKNSFLSGNFQVLYVAGCFYRSMLYHKNLCNYLPTSADGTYTLNDAVSDDDDLISGKLVVSIKREQLEDLERSHLAIISIG